MEVQMSSSSLGAMGSLLGKLCSLLVSPEDQLPEPLQLQKDKLELLKQDLEEINKFLVNLSWMEAPNMMVKHWMNEVRDLSYDIDDYIDKTMHSEPNTDEVSRSEVDELSSLVKKAKDAHERHNRYDLGRWASDPRFVIDGQGWIIPRLNGEVTELVGISDSKAQLITQLNIDVERRLVVSIHGPVGVGKTTLAEEVYRQIGGQFQCRAFVRASKMPDTRRLLRSMIFQVQRHQQPPQGLTVQDLIDHLRKLLQQKRYLIVIDGLWETTSWDIVSSAFPEDTHCSRVLVTTDIQEVALECCDYQSDGIFTMEPLSRNDTRELLFNRAFGSNHECSEQLKEVSEEIIRKCCGFPLATLCIARVLAREPNNSELWHHIKESLSCDIGNNLTSEDMLRGIIGLSYNSLPHHLKTCLLYFHMYPEGYMFLKTDLVKQWAAEGFIGAVDGKDTSEIAESYFDELVCRGFIQPNCIDFSDGVMFYTVHSTIFEVIRCKSMEGNFNTVIDYSETSTKLSAKVRRLSIRFSNAKYATKPEGITLSRVRSLIFYGLVECLPSITEFETLRVLNLEFWGAHGDELDLSGINRLFQLRYLWVSTNVTVKLPTMMKSLQYLETLEIYAKVTTVPTDIVNLPTLQHLCLHGDINLPDGIAHMRSLRTLQSFDLSSNSEDNVRSLGELKNLHQLHLTCSVAPSDRLKRNLIALVSSLGKLGNLNSLVLAPGASCTSIYSDCSNSVSCVPASVQILELLPPICIFSRLPQWFGQLRNLRILKVVVTDLLRDDMDVIIGLQELTNLSLYVRKPTRESIVFKSATFPVLKYFKFRCGVLHLAFQAKAMPNLQKLKLEFNAHRGDQYDGMLAGIEHLLNLREVAGRIGAGVGVEESDRMAAESAFIDTISKNSGLPTINMLWVDLFDEEISQFSDLPASTSHLDGIVIDPGKTLDVLPEASPYSNQNPTATVDIADLVAAGGVRGQDPADDDDSGAASMGIAALPSQPGQTTMYVSQPTKSSAAISGRPTTASSICHSQGFHDVFGYPSDGFDSPDSSQDHPHQHDHQQQQHVAQQSRRDKLRVQGFDPAAAARDGLMLPIEGDEHAEPGAVYEHAAAAGASNMLSEMFNFPAPPSEPSATELLASQMNANYRFGLLQGPGGMAGLSGDGGWLGAGAVGRAGLVLGGANMGSLGETSSPKQQGSMAGLVTDPAAGKQLFLMNPEQQQQSRSSPTSPQPSDVQQHHEAFQAFGGGGGAAGVVEGQGLSLSLSPSLQQLEMAKQADELRVRDGVLYFNRRRQQGPSVQQQQQLPMALHGQVGALGQQLHVGYGPAGVAGVLRNSKYTRAAQELLDEFCSVGRGQMGGRRGASASNPSVGKGGGGASSCGAAQSPSSPYKEPPQLSPADRLEQQHKKAKIISMLNEVDRLYDHYCDQMQMVVNFFDSVMGFGAATPYTALAQKTMSRHFRCLKDAIASQLRNTCELLGEKDAGTISGLTKGETPRLRAIDQSLRQQRAFHHVALESRSSSWSWLVSAVEERSRIDPSSAMADADGSSRVLHRPAGERGGATTAGGRRTHACPPRLPWTAENRQPQAAVPEPAQPVGDLKG